ncbi:MAG: hypothetical protein KC636_39605, partial [Myxococcales bacterium]|nr:hypothetical protein [Myxococcales bacterium]
MALIKHRPEILVYVPQEIVPGASFKVRAVIDCRARLPVSGVEIELMGVSVWMLSSQQSRYRDEEQFFRSVARVRGAGPMG